jgi:hypothetical protein
MGVIAKSFQMAEPERVWLTTFSNVARLADETYSARGVGPALMYLMAASMS